MPTSPWTPKLAAWKPSFDCATPIAGSLGDTTGGMCADSMRAATLILPEPSASPVSCLRTEVASAPHPEVRLEASVTAAQTPRRRPCFRDLRLGDLAIFLAIERSTIFRAFLRRAT